MNSRISAGSTVVDGGRCPLNSPSRQVGKNTREKTATEANCPLDSYGAISTTLLLDRGNAGTKEDAETELHAMRQQVKQLQAQLQVLEERLAEVEMARTATPTPRLEILPRKPGVPPTFNVPSLPELLGNADRPKIWGQREVNGWTAFFISCGTP